MIPSSTVRARKSYVMMEAFRAHGNFTSIYHHRTIPHESIEQMAVKYMSAAESRALTVKSREASLSDETDGVHIHIEHAAKHGHTQVVYRGEWKYIEDPDSIVAIIKNHLVDLGYIVSIDDEYKMSISWRT